MSKKQIQKKKAPKRTLRTVVLVDAPSGEGKEMQLRTALSHKAVLAGLVEHRGHIRRACDTAGVNRDTYYEFLKDPDFARAVKAIKEGTTDDYEEALHTVALDAKVFPAIKYYLDNHAQDRGYGKEVKAQQDAAKNNSAPTANIQINLDTLSPETLRQLKAAVVQKDDN